MGYAIVPITLELFADYFRNGEHHFRIEHGIPDDAVYCGSWIAEGTDTLRMKFQHQDFDDTRPGDRFPLVMPQYTPLKDREDR